MCGRFVQAEDTDALVLEFEIDVVSDELPDPSFNIKPTQQISVIAESVKGADVDGVRRLLEPARWSLIPPWVTDGKPKFSTFNARSEEAASKPTWKSAVASKRCIIPVTGYFEWHTEGTVKTPNYIHGDGTLALAGLYGWWRASENDPWMLTGTILTMAAVPELAHIHDRTPVTLPRDLWDLWLDPSFAGDQALVDVAVAAARPVASALQFHEVAPVRGDGPELIKPVTDSLG